MSKETIVTSAFIVHRSEFSCSLAAALLTAFLSILLARFLRNTLPMFQNHLRNLSHSF